MDPAPAIEDFFHSGMDRSKSSGLQSSLVSWLMKEFTMAPNVVSLARLLSGPCIAALIIQESWPIATACLILAGVSDWLDGYLAKTMKYTSVMGSFLDPLADKTLICSTAGALLYQGILPLWVAAPVIARDVCLVVGTYVHYTVAGAKETRSFYQHLLHMRRNGGHGYHVQPTLISKANTAMQLSLVAACIGHGWMQWPSAQEIDIMAKLTVLSTLTSWGAYTWGYFNGKKVFS